MKIRYQGEDLEVDGDSLAALLQAKGVEAASSIVECDGEIYAPGADLSSIRIKDGSEVNLFRVVAGG